MASKPPVAVFDACVLYPFHLRNILIQCVFDGLVEARWTDDIHAEWMRNLAANSAANALGLSTQVPVKTAYLTDGPSRPHCRPR